MGAFEWHVKVTHYQVILKHYFPEADLPYAFFYEESKTMNLTTNPQTILMKRISHIAIAVKDLDQAVQIYRDELGFHLTGTEEVIDQKVKTAFLTTEAGEHLELLCPTSPDSPISKFLEKHGEGLHHIAFFVNDIPECLSIYKTRDPSN